MATEGWGEKEICTKGVVDGQTWGGGGGGGVKITPAQKVIVILQNSVCPLADFLIGEVKLQLSITSQMCQYYQYPYYNIIRKKFLKRKILT